MSSFVKRPIRSNKYFNEELFSLINSPTVSNSCASTTPTRDSNSSSTITCSSLNKKNTRRKAFNGSSLTSVWTCKLVLTLSRRYEEFLFYVLFSILMFLYINFKTLDIDH